MNGTAENISQMESTSKINILHIIDSLRYGGGQKILVTLIRKFDRDKYEFTICCLGEEAALESEIENLDVNVIKLGMSKKNPFTLLFGFFKLLWVIKTGKINIVHTHLRGAGFLGRICAKLAGVPIIITHEHGMTLWKKRRHIFFERFANRFTDMRIAVSETVRENRISKEKTNPQKIITILNGVDIDYFNPDVDANKERKELNLDTKTFCIGSVSRLAEVKGLKYLLDAAKVVIDCIQNVSVLIVGDGPMRKELQDYAMNLGITGKTIFTGYRSDIPKMLALMDVYVLPSIREGIPVSLLEAMAMQKPVIATSVGGVPEVIENQIQGILVPPENPEALSKAIIKLLNDKEFRIRLANAGRKRVMYNFSIANDAKKIEMIYDELIRKKLKGN